MFLYYVGKEHEAMNIITNEHKLSHNAAVAFEGSQRSHIKGCFSFDMKKCVHLNMRHTDYIYLQVFCSELVLWGWEKNELVLYLNI